MPKNGWREKILHSRIYKIIILCAWLLILGTCLLYRDRFSVESVLQISPQNMLLAALFMMVLFALKSMSIFIFSGILFAADGILFPLPAAIGLNIIGAGIMVSLPYFVGKKIGKDMIDKISGGEHPWNAPVHCYGPDYGDEHKDPWFTGVFGIARYSDSGQRRFHWRFLDLLQEKSEEGGEIKT